MTDPFKKLEKEIDSVEDNLDSILTKDKKEKLKDSLEEMRTLVEQIKMAHPDDLLSGVLYQTIIVVPGFNNSLDAKNRSILIA